MWDSTTTARGSRHKIDFGRSEVSSDVSSGNPEKDLDRSEGVDLIPVLPIALVYMRRGNLTPVLFIVCMF